ncbi:uncharacterized protein LOC125650341 [Ostrea edulis]|uniref:uncharacterized protein LOC125650341 n=1 Tax=Ostrea edulis TaxID=37623 RepID=UPI0020950B5E|nr:uncharacterized protein LOC125650341 [Ostrea edulis]XP_048734519.1 uncharacterized protein LOC125650341 [Ostrea edulis]
MEQPLDLSQNSDSNKRSEYNMDVEEPICQYPNCSCPLKHITTLESPKHRQSPPGTEQYMIHSSAMDRPYDIRHDGINYDGSLGKRTYMDEYSNTNFYHPKRRKIEMYKQRIARSTSENSLAAYDDPYSTLNGDYQGYAPNGSIPYPSHEKNNEFCKPRSINTPIAVAEDENSMEGIFNSTPPDDEYRERSYSTSHIQRLPKKRQYTRQYSTSSSSQQISPRPSQSNSHLVSQSQRYASQRYKPMPSATVTSEKEEEENNKETASSIKAEMIREIDNCPDTDDVATFRKQLFETIVKSAKQAREAKLRCNNTGAGLVALDYLISKNVLHSEDKPFKARNNHIQQIIRGEKPGKLCLMDIVELQVEIGLA